MTTTSDVRMTPASSRTQARGYPDAILSSSWRAWRHLSPATRARTLPGWIPGSEAQAARDCLRLKGMGAQYPSPVIRLRQ